MKESRYKEKLRSPYKNQIKPKKGWPKELPCLGECGKYFMFPGPETRLCSKCKQLTHFEYAQWEHEII